MRNFFALSLLAVLLVACAQSKKAPALVQPEDTPPPPPPLVPIELSLFDEAEGSCAWTRLRLPGAEAKPIAQFPVACAGVDVVWSADLTRALVFFNPKLATAGSGVKAAPSLMQAFEVELATGQLSPLAPPPKLRGELELFGLTSEGVVALSLEHSAKLEKAVRQEMKKKKRAKLFPLGGAGEKISIELPEKVSEGALAIAHAWLLKEGTWKRVESKLTTTGWVGVKALDTYKQFGPSVHNLLDVRRLPEAQALEDAELLSAWTPKSEDARERWEKQSTAYGDLFAWMKGGEFDTITGLLLYQRQAGAPAPLVGLGFAQEEFVAVSIRDTWLLVVRKNLGTSPRVYNLRNGESMWVSDSARAVVFWPE